MNSVTIRSTGRLFGGLLPETAARVAEHLSTHPMVGSRPRRLPEQAVPVTFRFGLRGFRWGHSGPPVLALHGWEGYAGQFEPIGQALAAAGFRAYALTGPGHEPGAKVPSHPGLFVDALHEAASDLGELQAVIGHSMGGGAALIALANGLPAQRAVLIGAPAGYRPVLERIAAGLGLHGVSRNRFFERMETRTGLPLDQTVPAQLLPSLAMPLLIIHDRNDAIVPFADAVEVHRHAREAELVTTKGLGHGRILRDQNTVDRIVSFARASLRTLSR